MTIVNNMTISLADDVDDKSRKNHINNSSHIYDEYNAQSTGQINELVESMMIDTNITTSPVNRISSSSPLLLVNNKIKKLTKRSSSSSSSMMIMMNHNLHRHHHQHHPHYLNLQQQQQQQQQQQNPQINRPETSTAMTMITTTSTKLPPTTYHYNNQRINHNKPQQQQNEWHSAIQQQQQQQYQWLLSSSFTTLSTTTTQHQPQKHQQLQLQHQRLQQQQLQQQQQCPEGPPEQWSQQLDVAGKALLSPIVFYGELISLAEDYGGRIGATFRLLKLIKPDVTKLSSSSSSLSSSSTINHHHSMMNHNNNEDLSILIPNPEYETQVKLYFVPNQNESMEIPFCALYMPEIWKKLRTKTRYILFAQQQILSSRGFMLPSHSSSSSTSTSNNNNNNDLHSKFHNHRLSFNDNNRIVVGHQLISMITYTIPETLSRNTSRLVRKILCRDCAKPARIAHSSRERLDIIAKHNITLSCRVDGNPIPWIEWYRNGRRLRTRRRVIINTRRLVVSHTQCKHCPSNDKKK
ncbi:negative regulator of glucose-controlled proteins [Dermatophagoides farinae]|uniref:Negative regulator of glucose-controlled proteins n=1 Tax=Dermatophagoides farinae TaxID=6954 RepID=A0A922HS53_DERFA|nr:negative regulator of glucose-controlled proteins [Dermatophagoides farinae]